LGIISQQILQDSQQAEDQRDAEAKQRQDSDDNIHDRFRNRRYIQESILRRAADFQL
jgi:hypothetical protein